MHQNITANTATLDQPDRLPDRAGLGRRRPGSGPRPRAVLDRRVELDVDRERARASRSTAATAMNVPRVPTANDFGGRLAVAASVAGQAHRAALSAARTGRDELPATRPERLAAGTLHHVDPQDRRVVLDLPAGRAGSRRRAGAWRSRSRAGSKRRVGGPHPRAGPGSAASRPRSGRGPGRRCGAGGRAAARSCREPMIPGGADRAGRADVVSAACRSTRSSSPAATATGSAARCRSSSSGSRVTPSCCARCARSERASVDRVVVVSHPGWIDETRELVDAASLAMPVSVVAGGATRNESTRNGLAALDGADDDIVVVHDAVRPLVPLDVIQRSIEPILSGRADGDRHRDPERGHPGDRRGRPGRRDPGAEPLSPRPDAADVPARHPRPRLRGGHPRGRPVGDRRLQPRPAARAGVPDRGGRGRRGERQDHDPDRHGHGRPDAPDEGHVPDRGARGRARRSRACGCSSSAARAGSGGRSRTRRPGAGRSAEVDGGSLGPGRPRLRERRGAPRRGGRAPGRDRPRRVHRRHPAHRVRRRHAGARAGRGRRHQPHRHAQRRPRRVPVASPRPAAR